MHIRHVLPQAAMGRLPRDPWNSPLTGVINGAWNLAIQQAAAGHVVEVVGPGEQQHHQQISGVNICWLSEWNKFRTKRYDFSYLCPLLLYTLKSKPVDVTHVHSNPFFVIPPRSRVKVLHYQNSPIKASPRYDKAVARANQIICCSDFIRRQLIATVPSYSSSRMHVVHNGVDRSLFTEVDRLSSRAIYNLADDQLALLYVGRIGPEKGLLVLIDALEKVMEREGCKPVLLVAGTGTLGFEGFSEAWKELQEYEQRVRRQASRLPVRFLGNVPRSNLPSLYKAADVFVCPSVYQEPFGMVVVEAAAAGVPVIASNTGGIAEAIGHEQNGLLVPPGDASSLADALVRLIADRSFRHQLGLVASQTSSQYDWSVLATKVMAIYAQAL